MCITVPLVLWTLLISVYTQLPEKIYNIIIIQ